MNTASLVTLESHASVLLALGLAGLILTAWVAIQVWHRHQAGRRGRILVESVMSRRGIAADQLNANTGGRGLDEARARCRECALQRACLRTLIDPGADIPVACPNRTVFDRLTDRIRPPVMRYFRLSRSNAPRR